MLKQGVNMKCGWAGLKQLKPRKGLPSRTSTSALGHFLPASYLCTLHRLVWSPSRHPCSFPPSPSTFPSFPFLLPQPVFWKVGSYRVVFGISRGILATENLLCYCLPFTPAPPDGNWKSEGSRESCPGALCSRTPPLNPPVSLLRTLTFCFPEDAAVPCFALSLILTLQAHPCLPLSTETLPSPVITVAFLPWF